MKTIIAGFVAVFFSLFAVPATATERIPEGYVVAKTMEEALTLAKAQGKKGVLVYFYLNRCTNCTMLEELLGTSQLKETYGKDFVLMSMHKKDIETRLPQGYHDLTDKTVTGLRGSTYHSVAVVDASGRKVCRQESPFTCTSRPEAKMAGKFYDEVLKKLEGKIFFEDTPLGCMAVPLPNDC